MSIRHKDLKVVPVSFQHRLDYGTRIEKKVRKLYVKIRQKKFGN